MSECVNISYSIYIFWSFLFPPNICRLSLMQQLKYHISPNGLSSIEMRWLRPSGNRFALEPPPHSVPSSFNKESQGLQTSPLRGLHRTPSQKQGPTQHQFLFFSVYLCVRIHQGSAAPVCRPCLKMQRSTPCH